MESYLWQSALLMVVAYLLGAVLGCLLRRLFTSSAPAETVAPSRSPSPMTGTAATAASAVRGAPEPVQPKIETVAHPAPPQEAKIADSARFERVLTTPAAASSESTAAPATEPAPGADISTRLTAAATAATAAAAASAVAAVVEKTSDPAPASEKPAAPPDTILPTAGGSTGLAAVAAPIASTPADDLRRIADIDETTATALNQLGYTRFEQIAAWTAADTEKVRGALGHRSAREGWIEQAKILADGKQTGHTKRHAGETRLDPWSLPSLPAPKPEPAPETSAAAVEPEPSQPKPPPPSPNPTAVDAAIAAATVAAATVASAASAEPAQETAAAPPPASAPEPAPAPTPAPAAAAAPAADVTPDELSRIDGIHAATEQQLNANGIKSYGQISKWTASDVEKFDALIGRNGRISQENWIEQANILGDGKQTVYTRRMSATPSLVPPPGQPLTRQPLPPAEGKPLAAAPDAAPAAPSSLSAMAAAAAAAGATAAALSTAPASEATKPQPEPPARPGSVAAAQGVATAPLENTPNPPAPDAPAAASAPARPAKLAEAIKQNTGTAGSGVAGMRSVKSQLLSGETGPKGEVEDLKKIRGVGVLIEKKLNALGIYSYEQIANWSADDIHRISNSLDFKGRIEREGWVEQARILASGGQTEFSKRLT